MSKWTQTTNVCVAGGRAVALLRRIVARMVTEPEIASTILTSTSAPNAADRLVASWPMKSGVDNRHCNRVAHPLRSRNAARPLKIWKAEHRIDGFVRLWPEESKKSRTRPKFGALHVEEVPCCVTSRDGWRPSPDNDIPHRQSGCFELPPRLYGKPGSLVVEDLNSLNGSFSERHRRVSSGACAGRARHLDRKHP